jgi:ATP phosphoribosyltransferase regulatory subunit
MNLDVNSENRWLPDGFHFLGPTESSRRRILLNQLCQFLQSNGYSEVTLPSMDYSASFLNQTEGLEANSVLRFRDLSGKELSPGTDLTIQVVKGMAGLTHSGENPLVFYSAKRIRDHKKRNASRREIHQIGAERLGSSDPQTILKILTETDELLKLSGLKVEPSIVLGHNEILIQILDHLQLGAETLENLLYAIHTKNRNRIHSVCSEAKIPSSVGEFFQNLILALDIQEVKALLSPLEKELSIRFSPILEKVSLVLDGWKSKQRFSDLNLDLTLVRDLKYYTGFLFQGFLPQESEPVVTGGQYDHLFEKFASQARPACGFAIHIDTLESFLEI